MVMDVDWSHGAEHMLQNHAITAEEAREATDDIDALLYDPDPKSKSRKSARLIGYSPTRGGVLVIILVHRDHRRRTWWGANGWEANTADTSRYRKENEQ